MISLPRALAATSRVLPPPCLHVTMDWVVSSLHPTPTANSQRQPPSSIIHHPSSIHPSIHPPSIITPPPRWRPRYTRRACPQRAATRLPVRAPAPACHPCGGAASFASLSLSLRCLECLPARPPLVASLAHHMHPLHYCTPLASPLAWVATPTAPASDVQHVHAFQFNSATHRSYPTLLSYAPQSRPHLATGCRCRITYAESCCKINNVCA